MTPQDGNKKRNRPNIPGITIYPRGKKWAYTIYTGQDLLTGQRQKLYRGGFGNTSKR